MTPTYVFVCPGTADGQSCGIWMSAPGYCWVHPHVPLVPQNASALTGVHRDSYEFLHPDDSVTGGNA